MTTAVDAVCARAVERARDAAAEEADGHPVGEHLGTVSEGSRVVTHLFECTDPAYRGWRWSVTVARVPRGRTVTIDEVVLISGADSVVAPQWVPFDARITPEDLGAGDVIPADPLDDRLVPSHVHAEILDPQQPLPAFWEAGVGRRRVLSPLGRADTADRWYSSHGPDAQMAKLSANACGTCGFLLGIAGPLGGAFGVCANEQAPSDGRVVALDYGCGAHSENIVLRSFDRGEVVVDELSYEAVNLADEPAALTEPADQAEQAEAAAPTEPANDVALPITTADQAPNPQEDPQ
ncbi:MAG: DUF3027 domain-containing protein [Candidatus Nanopelagicales bacterium]